MSTLNLKPRLSLGGGSAAAAAGGAARRADEGKLDQRLPVGVTLDQHELVFEEGKWSLVGDAVAPYQEQVRALQRQVEELSAQLTAEKARVRELSEQRTQSDSSSTQRLRALEDANLRLIKDVDELRFRNKALVAMNAVLEADYHEIMREAGMEANN